MVKRLSERMKALNWKIVKGDNSDWFVHGCSGRGYHHSAGKWDNHYELRLLIRLEELLSEFDWSYITADDTRSFARGLKQEDELMFFWNKLNLSQDEQLSLNLQYCTMKGEMFHLVAE